MQHSDTYCYLGVVFHSNGNFKLALNELRCKAVRAVFGLKRVIKRQCISFDALMILFDSLIKPVLLYGCQIFTPYLLATRRLLNDPPDLDASKYYFNTLSNDCYDKFHLKFFREVVKPDFDYDDIFFSTKYAKLQPNDGIGTFWDVYIIILLLIYFS